MHGMGNRYICFVTAALLVAVLCSGCISGDGDQQSATLPPGEAGIDGIVHEGEYTGTEELSGSVTMYWRVDGDILTFAVMAKTDGMVSVGFNPTQGMKDADMVIGWVDATGAVVFDCYATGASGPHPPDMDLGGTSDFVSFAGTETDGMTTLEVSRLMLPDDMYDATIVPGTAVDVIWAISGSDDFYAQHSSRGGKQITFE